MDIHQHPPLGVSIIINNQMEGKKMKENERIMWADSRWRLYLVFSFIFLFMSLLSYATFLSPNSESKNILWKVIGLFILGFFLWVLYRILVLRFNYLTNNGIRIGNLYYNYFSDILSKKIALFINFKDIKEIKLQNRAYIGAFGGGLNCFLIIKTKDDRKYDCHLYDKSGFIESLKKVSKEHLLKE